MEKTVGDTKMQKRTDRTQDLLFFCVFYSIITSEITSRTF